jgi:hypothetical protein
MFSEFFKINGFRGIIGNQGGEKEMWGGKRNFPNILGSTS